MIYYSQLNFNSTDRAGKTKVAVYSHDSQVTKEQVLGLLNQIQHTGDTESFDVCGY